MKTLKRLVSCLLVLSMILSMFLTVTAVENEVKAAERTGITIDRVTSQNKFGESVTHAEGYYWTDKKLEEVPVTYEAWVYMPSSVTYPKEGNVILSTLPQVYAAGTANFFSFELKNGSEPKLMFGYNNKEVTEVVFWNEGRVPKDQWVHLALVHDTVNQTVSCYHNGELKESKTFTFVPDSSAIESYVALAGDRATANARAFTGILGDVAVYADVRSAAEVRKDYVSGADVNDDDLLLYYQISADKQEKDIEDLSGNGYDMNYNRVFLTEEEMQAIRDKDDKEYAYSIAFIPDIQILTDYFPNKLPPVFDYVLDNIDDKNIKYMVTLGDLTDTNTQEEWDLVKSQLDRFNGKLPYSIFRGNHDGVWKNQPAIYDSIFADPNSDYYKHVQANGGFYDTSSVKNTYLLFEEGGTKYMLLNLDYGITDEKVLDWADEVIEAHPDRRVIVATHAWLGSHGEPFATGEWSSPGTEVSGSIDPDRIWNEHLSKHANIDMIVCGHSQSDQILCTPVVGDNGNVVYQVLMDSQCADLAVNGAGKGLGGVGVVGIMYFTEDGQFAKIEYYSTIFERYYYEGHTDISLDFEATEVKYSVATDTKGTPLNVKVVNGQTWTETNGELKMPAGPVNSFLLFDSKLNANRIEATVVIRDNLGWDTGSHRNGLVFALTDHDGDGEFDYAGSDVSYYWAFVTDDDKVEVRKMGKYQGWSVIGTASATLTSLGIDVTKGVTLAAEWDDEGHIKVYANEQLVQDITDTTDPLTGDLYGMLVYKYGNSQGSDYAYPYDAPVTSFIAGKVIYKNCIDVDGNPLNVKVVNGQAWVEKNGTIKMPQGYENSFLLFDNELETNRVEATIVINDNENGGDTNHRNGLVFALTDYDHDFEFAINGSDVSYYWAYINDWGCVAVIEMGKYGNWQAISTTSVDLSTLGIDVTKGVALAAEWDDQGHIKVYANGMLVQDLTDTTPLTGNYYGLLVNKYANTQGSDYTFTYDAPVLSVVAGKTPIGDVCTDADGSALNPVFVNGVEWTVVDGKLKMAKGHHYSFLLFDDELTSKRIEATLVINDNTNGDGAHRNGLVFALTDHDGDLSFAVNDTGVSYYWAFVNDYGCVEVIEMGKFQTWHWLSPAGGANLSNLGIDVTKGVTLAVEWDNEGNIKVFANGILVQDIKDSTPLTGNYYGMLVNKWGNTQGPDYAYPYNAYTTSFVAGGASETAGVRVDVTVDPTDAGTVTGVGNYYIGQSVTLTATPNAGYNFVGWYEGDTLVSAEATLTFAATDRNLTAKFTNVSYTVTVTPEGNGTATGGGTFGEGTNATITATPDTAYKFAGWYVNGELVSTEATYTFAVNANIELTAKFEKVEYTIVTDAQGNLLNPYFINGNTWTEENGTMKPAQGAMENFILFDNALNANRIEATFRGLPKNNDNNTRHGIVFAVTDTNGDHVTGMNDGGASYYFVCVSGYGEVQLIGFPGWVNYTTGGSVDVSQDVTLAVEWDADGNVKVFANGELRIEKNVGEALTGNLHGVLMRSWANTSDGGFKHTCLLTSYVAGGELSQVDPDEPDVPVVPDDPTAPDSYENCTDAAGNHLNPYFVNGKVWVEENGTIKMPAGNTFSFLLFDTPLANNRIEATIYPNDLHGSADDRNGIVFALTDHGGDSTFNMDSADVSYYWAFINGNGAIEVAEMGKYQNWYWLTTTAPTLSSLGIDPAQGVTLAAEWNTDGCIKIYVNGKLVHDIVDATPLTGNLYGMLVRKWGNSGDIGAEDYPYDAPVTSFIAGAELVWAGPEEFTITTTPTEGGSVEGAGDYVIGTSVTLTATPNEGYAFAGWYENGKLVSTDMVITFTAEADLELTAKFVSNVIYGDANGDGQINMKDIILVRKYIASFDSATNTSSVEIEVGADANGDGQINVDDVELIRSYVAKYDYDSEKEEKTYALQDVTDSLKLHGRTSVTSEGIVCDHSATGIEFSAYIEGKLELTVLVSADTYFTVYVDGERQITRYNAQNGTVTLTIANFIEGGVHNIRVLKQTESANSLCVLQSVTFKGSFEEAPAEKDLFIEFLGDSITSGFGNMCMNGADNAGSALNQDATQTYAYLAAQKLGADHSLVSCSGIGVTSSWSGDFTMKDFFASQSYFRSTSAKYEKTFTPDIVVINLGTNDNSKGSDAAQFKEDVKALIALVRSTYGEDVKIVWAANMMGACMQTYSQAAINELGGEAAGLYFCTLTANQEGGYYHPSKAAHVVAATELANFIQEKVISE